MESSAGFILCLVAGAAELCRRNRRAGMIFFALVAVLFLCNENGGYGVDGMAALLHPSRPHVEMESAVRQQAWVKRLSASALPVAVDNESYRTLDLYASPELRGRSWGLTDMAGAEKHEGAMTDQINLVQFSKRFPMQNMEVGAFMEANPDFLMVVQREARHFEWLPQYLLARRGTAAKLTISLLELDNRNGMAVYEVRSGATAGDQKPAIASTVERP
jgi:hypothetical protein